MGGFFFFSFSTGFYPSLLQRKPEQISGYWVEAVLCLPGSFSLGGDFIFFPALHSTEFSADSTQSLWDRGGAAKAGMPEPGPLSLSVTPLLVPQVTGDCPRGPRQEPPANRIPRVITQRWKI